MLRAIVTLTFLLVLHTVEAVVWTDPWLQCLDGSRSRVRGPCTSRKCAELAAGQIWEHCLKADFEFLEKVKEVFGPQSADKCSALKTVMSNTPGHDPCHSASACEHGQCQPSGPRSYYCICPVGYSGTRCDVRVTTTTPTPTPPARGCHSRPCQHGGICHTKLNAPHGYLCNCPAEFSGRVCETRITAPYNCAWLPNGDYPDPKKCPSESFYKCADGRGWLFRCDVYTFYSPVSKACVWRNQVPCH